MSKAKIVVDSDGKFYGVKIMCAGCMWPDGSRSAHVLQVDWTPTGYERSPHIRPDPWTFNGDMERPVFGPSLLCRSTRYDPPVTPANAEEYERNPWPQKAVPHVCHSFIGCNGAQPGQIIYLGDCTHRLVGQTIDLPDVE